MSESERELRKRRLERDEIEALAAQGLSGPEPLSRPSESRAEARAREKRAERARLSPEMQALIYERGGLPPPPPPYAQPGPTVIPPYVRPMFKVVMKCQDGTEPKSYVRYPADERGTLAEQKTYAKRAALKAMTSIKKKCEVTDVIELE